MRRILISLLGAMLREARYQFPNNAEPIAQSFCALAIIEDMRRRRESCDELVVIGTTGSCWHRLAEIVLAETDRDPAALAQLKQLQDTDNITHASLLPWQDRMTNALCQNCGIRSLKLVPIGYTDTPDTQMALIRLMGDLVGDADHIVFDLTHGLRHISMFGLMAAVILQRLKKVPIEIHYGAYDISRKRDDMSPVMRLDSLSTMLDYLSALGAYDKDGDYAAFAPLMEHDTGDRDAAELLRAAAYHEQMGNFQGAQQKITELNGKLDAIDDSGPFAIFRDELKSRLQWIDDRDLYTRQRGHAIAARERGDLMRSAIWAVEAVATRVLLLIGADPSNHDVRFNIVGPGRRDRLETTFTQAGIIDELHYFSQLKSVRNRFAHAYQIRVGDEVSRITGSRRSCERFLDEAFAKLLP